MRKSARPGGWALAVAITLAIAPMLATSLAARAQGNQTPAGTAPQGDFPTPERAETILARSPLHGEWLNVRSGVEIVRTYIVHPVRKDRGPCLIVIAEGIDDWARAIGDRLAQEGFTALVADLSTNSAEMGRRPSPANVGQALRALKHDDLVARVQSVYDYATRLPAVNEKVAVVSFGWGAVPAVAYAAAQPALAGAVMFYGMNPAPQDLAKVKAPVLGFYAADDRRTPANLTSVQQNWQKAIDFLKQNTN
jgi:carboxymethylenebutenolidase